VQGIEFHKGVDDGLPEESAFKKAEGFGLSIHRLALP
jgi:hypothetical protein